MAINDDRLNDLTKKYFKKKGFLIPLLQEVQSIEGYISNESIKIISDRFNIKISEIYGVATFYSMFRLKPQGRHTIKVCKGTACHVSGADSILDSVKKSLDLKSNEDTTSDNLFTVSEVACLGCCSLAPAIMIDDKTYGNLTSDKVSEIINDLIVNYSESKEDN